MIKIITPGIYSSIQDLGRRGYRKFGMPLSGAMDLYALKAANRILGNIESEAAIEITGAGFSCEFTEDIDICITGADLGAVIKNREKKIDIGTYVSLKKGDILLFAKINKGFRAYLQIKGGLNTEIFMNSKSMKKGEKLNSGMLLKNGNSSTIKTNKMYDFDYIKQNGHYQIHISEGPDYALFSKKHIKSFLSHSYDVTRYHDRMGIRLKSQVTIEQIEKNIITKPVFPGCIQIPGNQQPIIIMNDGQTTGGYPVIAVVKNEDLKIAGQLKYGDKIKFLKV